MDECLDFEHDHTMLGFWLRDGELSVTADHKFTDSHRAVITLEQARKLRDWLDAHLGEGKKVEMSGEQRD